MSDKINENLNKVGDGFINVGKKASMFGASVAALGVAAVALARNVGNVADRLLDLRDITGMATDTIQEYQYVAKIAGVSTEAVTNATEGLVRRLRDVSEDGGGAVEVMRNLGVAVTENDGSLRNSGKIMDDLIVKLANMDNASQRNAYGAQLFGGAWKDMAPILGMGAENIAAIRQEAHDLGLIMSEDALNSANEFRQANERLGAQMDALKNKIGAQLAPVLTKVLVPAIQKYLIPLFDKVGKAISHAITWFSELNPNIQKIIGVVAGLAVAMGPLLLAIGGIIKFLPILASGFAVLTGPIGLVVAGVVALTVAIYKNWDTVKQWAEDIANYFIRLYNQSILFRAGIEAVILNFKNIFEVGKFVFFALVEIVTLSVKQMVTGLKGLGKIIEGIFTFDTAKIKEGFSQTFTEGIGNIKNAFVNIGKDAVQLFKNVGQNTSDTFNNAMNNRLTEVSFKPVGDKVKDAVVKGVTEGVAEGVASVGSGGARREQITGVGAPQSAGASGTGFQTAMMQLQEFTDMAAVRMQYVQNLMQEFGMAAEDLIYGSITSTFQDLGAAIGEALASGGNIFQAMGTSLIQSMGKFVSQMGNLLIEYGVMAKLKGKLDLAIAAGGPAAIFAGTAAIAAGIALSAIGSAISARAQGGLGGGGGSVSGSASVAQSSVTSQSFSAQSGNEVVFRISGTDLIGVIDRARGNNLRLN
jgi:hypothetical protein